MLAASGMQPLLAFTVYIVLIDDNLHCLILIFSYAVS